MFVASQKRKENIAEYLLYMWQVEDIIRACNLDIDLIESRVIQPSPLTAEQKSELRQWYESLIDMMRREEVESTGHLQINKNVMSQLVELHQSLLAHPRFDSYRAEYYKTLPFIVQLRSKAGDSPASEIETCFNALYGVMLLRLKQRQDISEGTRSAIAQISRFVGMLSAWFHKSESEDIFKADSAD